MSRKVLFFLILIVIGIVLIGYWYYSGQVFSKSILKLEILGPDTVQMGEEFEYTIRYKNNSDFTLEEPKLTFEYPEYSVGEDGKNRVIKVLQDIYPGDEQFVQLKTRLFGKENDLRIAKAYLSYRPKNLSANYESNTTFTSRISLVPLTLEFDLPTKLETGREVQFSINYFSNINYSLSGLKLIVEYPEKFEFSDSDPKTLEKSEWEISSLEKAEGGRIKINGRLTSQAGEKVTFGAKIGIWQDGDFILLKETTIEVETIEPLLYISQQINESADYIASPGEALRYKIYFKNIGTTSFENLYLINKLDSLVFDLSTIKFSLGEARVDDNLVIWDWKQVSSLRSLDVQEEGSVEFEVKLKDEWPISYTQPNSTVVKNKVNISQISQEFQTKVNTRLVILQRGMYEDNGVFGNSGPIPPAVGQSTTYTIEWQVKNFYNDIKNVKVRATLPQGVTLTGKISPDTEISKFSFDSTSREIVWTVASDLTAGTGISNTPPNVFFQVSFVPTFGQAGTIMTLINKPKITGEDQWTNQNIIWEGQVLDTTLSGFSNPPENLEERE